MVRSALRTATAIGGLCFAALFPVDRSQAAQVVELLPLRNDILLVRITDGTIAHATIGQLQTAGRVAVTPLKTDALAAAAFTVTSVGDTAYTGGKAATSLARKSKGVDFANNEEGWINNYGFKPTTPYAVMGHWLYLTLPTPMQEGKAYTLTWSASALALDSSSANLTFNSASSRSEAVHVNVVGYAPAAPAKYGYLYHWAGDRGGVDFAGWTGKPFQLVDDATDRVAFTGTVAFRKGAANAETGQPADTPGRNFLGAAVWECDFSTFTTPGCYRLVVPGVGCSFPFDVGADVYRTAFHATMKGLYQNRSGIALVSPFADKARPAPHNAKLTPGFANRLKYTTTRFLDCTTDGGGAPDKALIEAGAKGNLTETWGWYQDAGDWDGYFSHLAIPNSLLLLYQLCPEKFADGELNLPESSNGIPDIVDEGAWLPRYFARLRAELKVKGWGSGGVGGRVFGDYWGDDRPNGIMRGSWQDIDRDWYVTGEDPFSSFRYASTAAQLAEILQKLGKPDPQAVDWLSEAKETYAWAAGHVRAGDEAISQNDSLLKDYRALAAAALFRATGDEAYHKAFASDVAAVAVDTMLNDAQTLAVTLYLSHPQPGKLDPTVQTRLLAALKKTSLAYTETSATARACRWGGDYFMPMVIGQASTPLIMPAVLGYKVLAPVEPAAAATALSVAYTTSDYFLGINPHNMTYVTGLGPRFPLGIFHMDDWLTGTTPHTGVVPYGPTIFATSWIPYRMNASIWWAWDTTFPTIDSRGAGQDQATAARPGTWPGHEAFFDQRGSPQVAEFTIWQTILPSAVTYGYLCDTYRQTPVYEPPSSPPATFSNIATRAHCMAGNGVTIGGFVITGGAHKRVLIRAVGPSLTAQGIPANEALLDPTIEVHDAIHGNSTIATNDDVSDNLNAAEIASVGSRIGAEPLLGSDTKSSALLVNLAPGVYSFVINGKGGTSGVVLLEIYDADAAPSGAAFTNIATRAHCTTGNGVTIGGFVLSGSRTKQVLLRAVGPTLTTQGIGPNEVLPDPSIELHDAVHGNALVAMNDNWGENANVTDIRTTGARIGATPLADTDTKSAALLLTLQPGVYSFIANGRSAAPSGIVLVEVYDAD